jgi:uncharacterized protein (TIGR03067 family)
MAGTWQVVSGEADGMPFAGGRVGPERAVIQGDKLTFSGGGKTYPTVTLKLDPTRKPCHMDMVRATDTLSCLYELAEGSLKLAMPLTPRDRKPGEALSRPASFETKDKPVMVLLLKPAKK